jgi:hypothetical protein
MSTNRQMAQPQGQPHGDLSGGSQAKPCDEPVDRSETCGLIEHEPQNPEGRSDEEDRKGECVSPTNAVFGFQPARTHPFAPIASK